MNKNEVNQMIHEAMGFDEFECIGGKWKYRNCGLEAERGGRWTSDVPDYHTPAGFFTCWDWAKDDTQHSSWEWTDFLSWTRNNKTEDDIDLVDNETFAPILAEWLKEKVKK